MVNPTPPSDAKTPTAEELMALLKDVTKASFTYRNGSTLTLEGEALTNWMTFQMSLVTLFTSVMSASKRQNKPPRTLGDELTKTDRS